jgi:hypothetical protein
MRCVVTESIWKAVVMKYLNALYQDLSKGIEENHKRIAVRITDFPTKIQIRYHLNESYYCAILLCSVIILTVLDENTHFQFFVLVTPGTEVGLSSFVHRLFKCGLLYHNITSDQP